MSDMMLISADKDGADLRRLKHHNSRTIRETGKHDEQDWLEADRDNPERVTCCIKGSDWERIFGGKK